MITKNEFIQAIIDAGWKPTNDAQYTKIEKLYDGLAISETVVQISKGIRSGTQSLRDDKTALSKALQELLTLVGNSDDPKVVNAIVTLAEHGY